MPEPEYSKRQKPILYTIDAPNMAHRAAAMGSIEDVLPNMLRRFLNLAQPTHAVALWDDPDGSFRLDMWDGYKADRPAVEGKGAMLTSAAEIFADNGIAQVTAGLGAEADDLIATIAAASPTWRVVMVSSDRDLLQCVTDRVFLGTRRQGQSMLWRPEDVLREYSVKPKEWPHMLALAGAKNGVPGLPGIGKKGACELIAEHGTVGELIRNVTTVPRKAYRASIRAHWSEALLYLDLLTLRSTVPMRQSVVDWRLD